MVEGAQGKGCGDGMSAFTIMNCEQRSAEWFAARAGRLTGSVAGDMLAKPKKNGDEPAARRNLRARLALERITGRPFDDGNGFASKAMQDGIKREQDALCLYQVETGELLREPIGFLVHNELSIGYSPDGVVGDFAGLVEVKCPEPTAHLAHLQGDVSRDYLAQMAHGLYLTGAPWCDFVSHQPHFPETAQLKVIRFDPVLLDVKLSCGYAHEVKKFLAEVDEEETRIRRITEAA